MRQYWGVDDYDIVPLPDDLQTVGYANIAAVLREMVAQRLAQVRAVCPAARGSQVAISPPDHRWRHRTTNSWRTNQRAFLALKTGPSTPWLWGSTSTLYVVVLRGVRRLSLTRVAQLWMQGSEAILVEMYSRVNAERHTHEYRYMLFCARSQKCCVRR